MDPQQLIQQYGVWIFVAINVALGLVLGLVPFSLGFIKGRRKIGMIGLAVCVIGGAILGVLVSLPACILFTWLTFRQPAPAGSPDIES